MKTVGYSFKSNVKPLKCKGVIFCPPPSLCHHPDDFPWFMRPIARIVDRITDSMMGDNDD